MFDVGVDGVALFDVGPRIAGGSPSVVREWWWTRRTVQSAPSDEFGHRVVHSSPELRDDSSDGVVKGFRRPGVDAVVIGAFTLARGRAALGREVSSAEAYRLQP